MGGYYVRDFEAGTVWPELTFTNAPTPTIVTDGPGAVNEHTAGSPDGSTTVLANLQHSLFTKSHNNSDSSYFELTVSLDAPGTVSYYREVQSETCCDFFRFYIDGAQQEAISGTVGWTQVSFPVGTGQHTFRWYFSTDGSVLSGFSGFRIAEIEVSDVTNASNPSYTSGGGGTVNTGGGSGTGNMLGSIFLGETMLGSDPGPGTGGGNGYGNTANMLGQFMFGEPMLGADPSNGSGGGTAPVGPAGSVWQLTGAAAGAATVAGDPTRNNWTLGGTVTGNATVSAGLSAPVHLLGESDGAAAFTAARLGTLDALSGGEADGNAMVIADATQSILRSKPGPAGEATVTCDHLSAAYSFQLVPTINAGAFAYGSFGGPVDLTTARADGLGTVSATISVYLSGGLSAGTATVTGDITRHILAGVSSGVATVTTNLTGDIFRLAGAVAGDSSLIAQVGDIYPVTATSAGAATVVGIFYYLIPMSARADGFASLTNTITVYNMAPQASAGSATVTGDYHFVGPQHFAASIAGDSSVVAQMRWRGLLLPGVSNGTSTVAAEVRRLWVLAGTPAGDSTGVGDFQIYTIPPGPIAGYATVTTTGMTIQGHMRGEADGSTVFGTDARGLQLAYYLAAPQASNGNATVKAYIYDYPGDFTPVTSNGLAGVSAKIVLAPLGLFGTQSQGVGAVTSRLGIAFTIVHAGQANGYATVDFALLQINDAGLSRGSALVQAQVAAVAGGASVSRGFATFILGPSFSLPGDLRGTTVDTWSGVGTWHQGSTTSIMYVGEIDQPPPVQTGTNPDGSPIYGPTSYTNEYSYWRYNSEHINVGVWDGTYTYGPSESGVPITDPETGMTKYVKVGPLKRQFALADPGQLGGWYVDDRSYRTRGPWGTSNGVANVRADLFVEAKNALYGTPSGQATVAATLVRLVAGILAATGNVALAVSMLHVWGGNVAKSNGPFLPIDDPRRGTDPDVFVPPVTRDRTMYV